MILQLIASHPTRTLIPVSFALALLSLSLTPSFISLIFLLTSLLLFTREPCLKRNAFVKLGSLWLTLTASISISHLQPSIHALSTPSTSIASLILLSGVSSVISLVPVIARNFVKLGEPDTQIFVFPILWTAVWLGVSWISPLGRLITWSPLTGIESYQWIRTLFGFAGIDWVAASWASIAAEGLESAIYTHEKEEDTLIDIESETHTGSLEPSRPKSKYLILFTSFLLALTAPSFFVNPLPFPPYSSTTTPLTVACVLPQISAESQLDRFIEETKTVSSGARIMLWPEGAVVFETETDKNEALERVAQEISAKSKCWVGVSFEERMPGANSTRDGLHRNGMALVGPEGVVEMNYYKRRLVPIAESFSQISSHENPPVHVIDYHLGPYKKHRTRAIPLSTSICLDFSAPLTSLSSRPALVLAPAKTWDLGVGRAMYELARARGEEIGAEVLWCDGGAGGLSGVAGSVQVGGGSWIKTIGVPYPAEQRRTVYGFCGDWIALVVFLGIPGFIWIVRRNEGQVKQARISAIGWVRQRSHDFVYRIRGRGRNEREAGGPAPQSQSLIDAT